MKNNRIRKRVYELLAKAAKFPPGDGPTHMRNLNFVFYRKPIKFISEDYSTVSSVQLEKTVLKGVYILISSVGCYQYLNLLSRIYFPSY
jgi:hypothetical protein